MLNTHILTTSIPNVRAGAAYIRVTFLVSLLTAAVDLAPEFRAQRIINYLGLDYLLWAAYVTYVRALNKPWARMLSLRHIIWLLNWLKLSHL